MDRDARATAAILGALVADAATLGFHWLYDTARLAQVAGSEPEFFAPDPAHYEGVAGYFAHGGKQVGDLTNYGAQTAVALEAMSLSGGAWDSATYLARFQAWFERGGRYAGYIDHATSETLDKLKSAEKGAIRTGAHDKQMPAFTKLVPLVARHAGEPILATLAEEAIRTTNDHEDAVAFGLYGARVLEAVVLGTSIPDALTQALEGSSDGVRKRVGEAMQIAWDDPAQLSAHFGAACNVDMAFPVAVAILARASDYRQGVRQNILAGGDNAGRSIFVGAVLGAANGLGVQKGVPPGWLGKLHALPVFLAQVQTLCAR